MPSPFVFLAIIAAFGISESSLGGSADLLPQGVSAGQSDWVWDLARVLALLFGMALGVAGMGWLVAKNQPIAFRSNRSPSSFLARIYLGYGSLLVDLLTLLAFVWILMGWNWSDFVRSGLGLKGMILIDEIMIMLPYFLGLCLGWSGLYLGQRALILGRKRVFESAGLLANLQNRVRGSWLLIVPLGLMYTLLQDVLARWLTDWETDPALPALVLLVMLPLIVLTVPRLVRLSWRSHPLPGGPLRTRLETVASRYGFRCQDILVWETNQNLVTAAITGLWASQRYVFLTDGLLKHLDEDQIVAVYGHEMAHSLHKHFTTLLVLLLMSLGFVVLLSVSLDRLLLRRDGMLMLFGPSMREILSQAVTLIVALGYFGTIFGMLSRRYERQADVFGSHVVSCGVGDQAQVATHSPDSGDSDSLSTSCSCASGHAKDAPILCHCGIALFSRTLSDVSRLNHVSLRKWDWRHGSTLDRLRFLREIQEDPQSLRSFQRDLRWLHVALAIILTAALVIAFASGVMWETL